MNTSCTSALCTRPRGTTSGRPIPLASAAVVPLRPAPPRPGPPIRPPNLTAHPPATVISSAHDRRCLTAAAKYLKRLFPECRGGRGVKGERAGGGGRDREVVGWGRKKGEGVGRRERRTGMIGETGGEKAGVGGRDREVGGRDREVGGRERAVEGRERRTGMMGDRTWGRESWKMERKGREKEKRGDGDWTDVGDGRRGEKTQKRRCDKAGEMRGWKEGKKDGEKKKRLRMLERGMGRAGKGKA